MQPYKTYFNWSTGKDSAFALHQLLASPDYQVEYLLTSVNGAHDRVSMHGVRTLLLQRQTEAIGLPSGSIVLPEQPTNEEYQQIAANKVRELRDSGFTHAAFGDIYLEDLRRYREQQLSVVGISAVFPLWGRSTRALVGEMLDLGFRAIVVCANASLMGRDFVGRELDRDFLGCLPAGVDPCGEEGEYHTFCFDAPYFKAPVSFTVGDTVFREYDNEGSKTGFWFCDLVP